MSQSVYYNDSEPFVCAWLKNLIAAGLIPAGDVDERPIQEVTPDDVKGYTQAHFFAGIGGWPYALQLAGWGDRPVWTGSCPCQPFSAAGHQKSHADGRHLWPVWYDLIRECHPVAVFGEQVSDAAGLGWLDAVALDLESAEYAIGACVLDAASFGAPHLRKRLWWVAANSSGESGIHKPHDWQIPQRLSYNPPYWEASPWDEAAAKVCSVDDGVPDRVMATEKFGNAIVPQVAAAFVRAYMDCAP